KASMEIPASQGGVVKSLKVKVGDKVRQGSVILELEASAPAESKGEAKQPEKEPAPAPDVKNAPVDKAPRDGGKAAGQADKPVEGTAGEGSAVTVSVPDIGDATDVDVIEIL